MVSDGIFTFITRFKFLQIRRIAGLSTQQTLDRSRNRSSPHSCSAESHCCSFQTMALAFAPQREATFKDGCMSVRKATLDNMRGKDNSNDTTPGRGPGVMPTLQR